MYKQPKVDLSYTDVTATGTVTAGGTLVPLLSSITRGDAGINNFRGNIINPWSLRFKYYWSTNQTYNSVRVLIFQWYDASSPALNGIVQSASTGIATISPMLVTNIDYIKVLYDKHHIIAPLAGGDSTPIGYGVCDGDVYIKSKKMKPIRFNATSNVVQDGNLYCYFISDDNVPSYPSVTYYSRLAFTE